jgi:hypothetical protein
MSTEAPSLPPDLEAGLRRLRLSAMRALSPELLVTAKLEARGVLAHPDRSRDRLA